jgi:hypothetical protein
MLNEWCRARDHQEAGVATDYDAPRTRETDEQDNLDGLKPIRVVDGSQLGEDLDPLDVELMTSSTDILTDDSTVQVLPPSPDEFACSRCHLIRHRSQLVDEAARICTDCLA